MPRSQAEAGLAAAVLHGKAKRSGMSREYAKEVLEKMRGRSMSELPEHAKGKGDGRGDGKGKRARYRMRGE